MIDHSVRPWKRFADMTATEWHEVVGVNLHSTFHLCNAALPHLVAAGNASIVAIGRASQSALSAPRAHASPRATIRIAGGRGA